MKKGEVAEKYLELTSDKIKEVKGVKLSYSITKNKKLFEEEYKALEASIAPGTEYLEFLQKRKETCEKYASRDEKGNILTETSEGVTSYSFSEENKEKTLAALQKLAEDFSSALEEKEKQEKEYTILLEEVSNIDESKITKVTIEDLPEDISQETVEILYFMIKD